MTPLFKALLGLLLFGVLCPWYSFGLASQHNNSETSGEDPLLDPVPDPSGSHCQRNENPKGLGFIGVKYNLLRGNPEGRTEMGGVDPGLDIIRKILKLTYEDGKAVPDQICYEPRQVCSTSKSAKIFGGTKRYQEKLNVDVTATGKSANKPFSKLGQWVLARIGGLSVNWFASLLLSFMHSPLLGKRIRFYSPSF